MEARGDVVNTSGRDVVDLLTIRTLPDERSENKSNELENVPLVCLEDILSCL